MYNHSVTCTLCTPVARKEHGKNKVWVASGIVFSCKNPLSVELYMITHLFLVLKLVLSCCYVISVPLFMYGCIHYYLSLPHTYFIHINN